VRFLVFLFILSVFFTSAKVIEGIESPKGTDILPTPKMMELTEKRFVLNDNQKPAAVIIMADDHRTAAIAAQEINDRIRALGGEPLPTVSGDGKAVRYLSGMNTIKLTVGKKGRSGDMPGEVREAVNVVSSKGEQGYAIRFCKGQKEGETAFLVGAGWQGMLYASTTFRLLIKKEGATIFATEAQVADWPDFKNRGLPVWPLPGSFEDFKKYVDWALRYKFNRIYTNATRKKVPDGFNLPTQEERIYLKRINNYAKERGIIINYALNWAVGSASHGGQDDDYYGAVIFKNHYYSWSNNILLRKRAAKIAQFAKDTDAGSLHFHCIDTYEESWDKRGKNDQARFGNDRASADANVISIFTGEIRRKNPGIELQFVVYPYHANFDLPGNERYKTWMTGLTGLIPHDVYLTVAELNRDQTDSWVAVVRQPLVHWINGNAFQWGRYFSTLPAFTKTAYYERRDRDIVIHWEPIGHFKGEVMQLIAAEYAWNVDAPGSGYIIEEKTGKINVSGGDLQYSKETVNGMDVFSWTWYNGTSEPKPTSGDLLLKACRLEFDEKAAPFIADFFKNNPVGWRSPLLFSRVLSDTMAGKELEACSDQFKKTNNALLSLKKALQADNDSGVRARLNVLLKNTYHQSLAITGATSYYKAMKLSTKGLNSEASQELKNGRDQMAEIKREMERQGIWSNEAPQWYEAGSNRLKIAEASLKKDRSTNLIKNPGFEEQSDPSARSNESVLRWSSVGSMELAKDSHSGKYAANLKLKPSNHFVYIEQLFTVPPDCDGFVEFWIKKDGDFRVIPILQYWNKGHTRRIEDLAVNDFTFNKFVEDYTSYIGRLHLPPHVRQAVFKVYADWFGFVPTQEKALYLDDVFVGCDIIH
jgi:hypothetical protein